VVETDFNTFQAINGVAACLFIYGNLITGCYVFGFRHGSILLLCLPHIHQSGIRYTVHELDRTGGTCRPAKAASKTPADIYAGDLIQWGVPHGTEGASRQADRHFCASFRTLLPINDCHIFSFSLGINNAEMCPYACRHAVRLQAVAHHDGRFSVRINACVPY